MNEIDAKCIIASVWTMKEYLGNEYTVTVEFAACRNEVEINIRKNYETLFTHTWQCGDTVESFLDGLNARFNSIFEIEQ